MLFIPNSVMLCVTTWCAYNSDTGSSFCKHIFVTLTLANYVLKPNPGPYAYLWPWQRCISNPDPRHCHRHCHSTQPWNTVSYPILNENCLQLSVDLHSSFSLEILGPTLVGAGKNAFLFGLSKLFHCWFGVKVRARPPLTGRQTHKLYNIYRKHHIYHIHTTYSIHHTYTIQLCPTHCMKTKQFSIEDNIWYAN